MYNNNISKDALIVGFRKGAKELIQMHAKNLQEKCAEKDAQSEQYQIELQQHRLFFGMELQSLYNDTLKNANHFSEILKKSLEEELNKSLHNYQAYYNSKY